MSSTMQPSTTGRLRTKDSPSRIARSDGAPRGPPGRVARTKARAVGEPAGRPGGGEEGERGERAGGEHGVGRIDGAHPGGGDQEAAERRAGGEREGLVGGRDRDGAREHLAWHERGKQGGARRAVEGAGGGEHQDDRLQDRERDRAACSRRTEHDGAREGAVCGKVTLFESHGVPVAVNVGDATKVLALDLLLGNTTAVGVRKALLVFREVERMGRESVEGQAIELGWIAEGRFDLGDRDYVRMAYKKTCWYTVIAPLRIGVLCGSPPGPLAPLDEELTPLLDLGFLAGIAFQIHDDLLNLEADETLYGKEISG